MSRCNTHLYHFVWIGENCAVSNWAYLSTSSTLTAFSNLFLLERIRIVRAPFVDRIRDTFWVIGCTIIVGGWLAIMGTEMISPTAVLSRETGLCRIGIDPQAGMAVIVFDTLIGAVTTCIFVWQLRPIFATDLEEGKPNRPRWARLWVYNWLLCRQRECEEATQPKSSRSVSKRTMKNMVIMNVIASIIILLNTILNNAIFLSQPWATKSHACQLMCLTDSKLFCKSSRRVPTDHVLVVVDMLLTSWLTLRPVNLPTTCNPILDSEATTIAPMSPRRATMTSTLILKYPDKLATRHLDQKGSAHSTTVEDDLEIEVH